ncbi:FHA domain-containing protein [Pseudonocardia sp. TRM90224]|uniref:FHA domain-containing protein n=1 Tax=Pseudonocardia sp. TRM90224 TaxID=2812678 RepID=UPI001E55DC09|nr:FHA domain-containing protein [Pseudonocardia sp. TRM90224]
MTATCPVGHESTTTDYCDVCGRQIGAAQIGASPDTTGGAAGSATSTAQLPPAPPAAAPAANVCANCGARRDGRFCEVCGHDGAVEVVNPVKPAASTPPPEPTAAPAAAVPQSWSATVEADRAWYEEVRKRNGPDAGGLEFPPFCPERRFELTGGRLTIGRRSRSRGIFPEIDLTGPPLDPGVSTLHALLQARDGGGWEIVDLNSTNGTTIGDTSSTIAPNTPIPLSDGDRIRLGAWTTITIRATPT